MKSKIFLPIVLVVLLFMACSPADGEFQGSEYMPDMGHSLAVEANVYSYYKHNTWDNESVKTLKELSVPRKPIAGTVPRGYAGVAFANGASDRNTVMEVLNGDYSTQTIRIAPNGSVPYYYEDTEEERLRATAEIIANPFPITADGLARGKELYEVFCGVCHGAKGGGNGGIYESGVYPAAPANFLSDEFVGASNGRYYHAIVYGKNVMGGYTDKISYEERWQVIHYIRSLQAKEKKLKYSEEANTLNASFGTPAASIKVQAMLDEVHEDETHKEEMSHDEADHSHDGHDEGHH